MSVHIAKYIEIIQKEFHKNAKVFTENYTNHLGRWCILQTKRHHNPRKSSPFHNECSCILILDSNEDLMVARKSRKE
jgi:hypothetical protein